MTYELERGQCTNRSLVTGGRGFIGLNLVRLLAAEGGIVAGLGHGMVPPKAAHSMGLTHWVNGDVEFANLQLLHRASGPFDSIFHLAGGSHVGRSFQNPAEDFQRTVTAAGQLLEWARLNSPATPIVIVSSAAVYGAGHEGPIGEDATLNPFSPYGAHKAILESLAKSYCQNFGLSISICRLFSVYGERLEKQLIYDLCGKCSEALASGQTEIQLGGTGRELRDWIHVQDVCRLLRRMVDQCDRTCPIVNGASGSAQSVAEIAGLMLSKWDQSLSATFSGQGRPGDPKSLVGNVTKAKSLGFVPTVDLDQGLQRVIDHYRTKLADG